jgi:hypothetical protein
LVEEKGVLYCLASAPLCLASAVHKNTLSEKKNPPLQNKKARQQNKKSVHQKMKHPRQTHCFRNLSQNLSLKSKTLSTNQNTRKLFIRP